MAAGNRILVETLLKSRIVLAAALLAGLNLGLILWGVLVLSPAIEELRTDILQREKAQESKRQPENNEGSREAAYAQNEKHLREFFTAIPDHAGMPLLMEELFDYAANLDLTIDRINYLPKKLPERRLVQYGLTFQVEGSYDQIKHLIFLLENSPRIIAINKVQFQRRATGPGKVVLGLDLETWFGGETP